MHILPQAHTPGRAHTQDWITLSDNQPVNSEHPGTEYCKHPQQLRPLQQGDWTPHLHTSDCHLLAKRNAGSFIFTFTLFCHLQIFKSNLFKWGKVLFFFKRHLSESCWLLRVRLNPSSAAWHHGSLACLAPVPATPKCHRQHTKAPLCQARSRHHSLL